MTLLSICIPTYNRASLLIALLRSLSVAMPEKLFGQFEIVISDNHSTDGTAVLLRSEFGDDPNIRVFSPEEHLYTAEENLCFALSMCRGDYVWTLGDDDAPSPHVLQRLADLLYDGQFDLLIFNFGQFSYNGEIIREVVVPALAEVIEISFLNFVERAGILTLPAGFSQLVFRRSYADLEYFRQVISVSRIYSHVFWLIKCFHDKRFAFINRPLVRLRTNPYVTEKDNHWREVSAHERIFLGGIWSVELVKLSNELVKAGIIEDKFFKGVVDRSFDHRWYFPADTLNQFMKGVRCDMCSKDEIVSLEDAKIFFQWAQVVFSENLILISLLAEFVECKALKGQFRNGLAGDLERVLASIQNTRWFDNFIRYHFLGFAVYAHADYWFAIRLGFQDGFSEYLELLDFSSISPDLGVTETEADLLAWIRVQPRSLDARTRFSDVKRSPTPFLDLLISDAQVVSSREIVKVMKSRQTWRFHDWSRMLRAVVGLTFGAFKNEVSRLLGISR